MFQRMGVSQVENIVRAEEICLLFDTNLLNIVVIATKHQVFPRFVSLCKYMLFAILMYLEELQLLAALTTDVSQHPAAFET